MNAQTPSKPNWIIQNPISPIPEGPGLGTETVFTCWQLGLETFTPAGLRQDDTVYAGLRYRDNAISVPPIASTPTITSTSIVSCLPLIATSSRSKTDGPSFVIQKTSRPNRTMKNAITQPKNTSGEITEYARKFSGRTKPTAI